MGSFLLFAHYNRKDSVTYKALHFYFVKEVLIYSGAAVLECYFDSLYEYLVQTI